MQAFKAENTDLRPDKLCRKRALALKFNMQHTDANKVVVKHGFQLIT